MQTFRYGDQDSQVADLYVPDADFPPVVCLLHGGFWRMPYERDQLHEIALDLMARGFAVWNMEYRRVGARSGGWPGTLVDVASGIDYLSTLESNGIRLDLDRVAIIGHSAGGQLALWAAASGGLRKTPSGPVRVRPVAAAGLAAVVDLEHAYALDCGKGAVLGLLGGSPDQYPDRYADSSPIALLPLGVKQLIIHGVKDNALPVDMARHYVNTAKAAGDPVRYFELPDAGHFEFLDRRSEAHALLGRWLSEILHIHE